MKYKITSGQSVQTYLFVIPSLLVILFYAWLATSGSGGNIGVTTYYYSYLAEAFLDGNLYLAWQPDPRLLAIDNPYDPLARRELEKLSILIPVDFSLYEGKFYLYWGPVPALILAAFQFFAHQPPVGDFIFALAFGIGLFLAQSILILRVWDSYFQTLPKWMLHLTIFLAGLTWPVSLLRSEYDHARIYQAAIAGGQFFLISGLLMAFIAIARPAPSNWRLVSAGLLWVLAIGSRHLLVGPIFFMGMMTAFWIIRTNAGFVAKTINFISLGMPLALGGAGLVWYNWARFGSITETGFSYALAGVNLQKHSTELFSGVNIIQNLYSYFFSAPGFISMFPFLAMIQRSKNIALPFYTSPKFYYAEPMTGLLFLFPFAIFALVPVIGLLSNLFKGDSETYSVEGSGYRLMTWISLCLSGSFFTAFLLILFFFWAGMRYLGDILPLLTILSVLGFWQGYRFPAHKPMLRKLYAISGIILAGVSILISTLLAISTI